MTVKQIMKQVKYFGADEMTAYGRNCQSGAAICLALGVSTLLLIQLATYFVAGHAGYGQTKSIVLALLPLFGPSFCSFQMLQANVGIPQVLIPAIAAAMLLLLFAANRWDCYRRVGYAIIAFSEGKPPVTGDLGTPDLSDNTDESSLPISPAHGSVSPRVRMAHSEKKDCPPKARPPAISNDLAAVLDTALKRNAPDKDDEEALKKIPQSFEERMLLKASAARDETVIDKPNKQDEYKRCMEEVLEILKKYE